MVIASRGRHSREQHALENGHSLIISGIAILKDCTDPVGISQPETGIVIGSLLEIRRATDQRLDKPSARQHQQKYSYAADQHKLERQQCSNLEPISKTISPAISSPNRISDDERSE